MAAADPGVKGNRTIDVWLNYYDEIGDDRRLASLRLLLSDDELSQARRFHFADDRKRYLVTRAMVRMLLSRYVRINPERWIFSNNDYGRPSISETIVSENEQAAGLCFNISHTRGLIALAVTRERKIGVDVESTSARPAPLRSAWQRISFPRPRSQSFRASRLSSNRTASFSTGR